MDIRDIETVKKLANNGNKDALNDLINYFFNIKNYTEAHYWMKELAKQDVKAQFYLGMMYLCGDGTENNYVKAFECFNEADKHGYNEAKYMKGICYIYGYGVEINKDLAIECFIEAAKRGSINAFYSLESLLNRETDETNNSEFNNRIEMLLPEQLYYLGLQYLSENSTRIDIKKALICLNKSVEKGNPDAQLKLANMYENGLFVEQDLEKAYSLYQKAYENSEQEGIGSELLGSLVLRINPKKNYLLSEQYFKKAYDLGFKRNDYYLNILNQLNGREIISIENTSELNIDDIDENKIGAIFINPSTNNLHTRNTLYTVKDYINCKKAINSVLENVDYVNESRDNELEVFMQIYVMLGKLIKYDQEINELDNCKNKDFYIAHNLIGGLLKRTMFM